jgi:hypothetical protein
MQLGGGLFLAAVGATLVMSAAFGGPFLGYSLVAGMAAGMLLVIFTRRKVAMRFGRPTRQQIWICMSAIAFEVAVFSLLGRNGYFMHRDILSIWRTGLAVVALHFFIMRWSHGPLILWLCVAILAWLTLCFIFNVPLMPMIAGDGLLKIVFGLVMAAPFLSSPDLPSLASV